MTSKHEGPVWPSYADLMTSLFGVTLVLFVLSHWLLTVKYKMSAEKWQKIQEIEESVSRLADKKFFEYQKEYKRHKFIRDVQFKIGDAEIPEGSREYLREAGERIATLIDEFRRKSDSNVKYMIIIEGMASADGYAKNFELSYQRALALYRLWQELGIRFDSRICEVIIAGSGEQGVGRDVTEVNNQRFLVQILPKVGAEGFENTPAVIQVARTSLQ
jgi:hypothetical protein